MRVCICGPRDFEDYDELLKAIDASGFSITEVVSGGASGVDSLGEDYATEHNIPVKVFKPDWNNINVPGAKIKTNSWGKEYNVLAGFMRNSDMVEYADAVIAIDTGSSGTGDTIEKAEKAGLYLYKHTPGLEGVVEAGEDIPF